MRVLLAIGLSVAIHALLLLGWGFGLEGDMRQTSLPRLKLAQVELSFAEVEDSAAEAASAQEQAEAFESAKVPSSEPWMAFEPKIEVQSPTLGEVALPRPKLEKVGFPKVESSIAPAPKQARIVAPPSLQRAIRPEYPLAARRRGEQGSVRVEFSVDDKGRVMESRVAVSSGFAELDAAAEKAVRATVFEPARDENGPCQSAATLTLSFQLRK